MAEDESSDCDYVDGASDARRFVTTLIKTCQTDVAEHGYKTHDTHVCTIMYTQCKNMFTYICTLTHSLRVKHTFEFIFLTDYI